MQKYIFLIHKGIRVDYSLNLLYITTLEYADQRFCDVIYCNASM